MSALILHIETATRVCSVTLSDGEQVLCTIEESDTQYIHGERLTLIIEQVMKKSGIAFTQLDAIAVSKGPGSYTGLRIGVSTAKGLAYALEKPLIAVGSLEALVYQPELKVQAYDYIIPMIDARRMEVFTATFNKKLEQIGGVKALILDEYVFDALDGNILLLGDGAEKCIPLFESNDAIEVEPTVCSTSKGMVIPAYQKYEAGSFEDVAYFEPFYLKDFQATKPKGIVPKN